MGNIIRRTKRFSAAQEGRTRKPSDGERKKQTSKKRGGQQQEATPTPQIDLEAEAVNRIRWTLKNDMETFVLNHLLMSVQYFENFDREMAAIIATDRGIDLVEHNRHCVMPDRVMEAASRHVQFKPQHGPRKHRAETLAAQRLFVVQDNVELCTNLDSMHYSSVDGPNYYFATEPSHRPGYMKLRCDESIISKKRRTTYEVIDDDYFLYDEPIYGSNIGASDSSIHTDDGSHSCQTMNEELQNNQQDIIQMPDRELQSSENIYEKNNGFKSPPIGKKVLAKKKLQAKSMSLPDLTDEDPKRESDSSSGYKSGGSTKSQSLLKLNTGSEYSYSTIKNLTTPQKLAQCTLGRIPVNSSEIPNECFQRVITRVLDSEDKKKDLFEDQYFLNSEMFMCNFADLFSDRFAMALDFTEESVEMATKVGAKITCNKFRGEDGHFLEEHYEVIPTLHCNEWPSQANEWLRRPRDTTIEGDVVYTWPTQRMVQKVKAMGYDLLPVGYMLKKKDRQCRLIEWQLAFPEAERYLEMCMSHAQIRCYLFTMTLYKNFLEPLDAQLGLLPSHIRTLLFWQCEKHFTRWPEDQPGDTIKKFLDIVYNALQEKKLNDYFVKELNLLGSTPDDFIHVAQEKLYRIKEHLLTHMLLAIKNLRFKGSQTGNDFYPQLNYKKLYQILTWENLVTLNNPDLGRTVSANQTSVEKQKGPDLGKNLPVDMWQGVKMANPNQKFAERAHKHIQQNSAARRPTAPKGSTESIDVKVWIRKGAEPLRRTMLLELFISQFIEMGKASNRFRATKQAHFYLRQAQRLTTLLSEEPTEVESARAFQNTISELRQASFTTTSRVTQLEAKTFSFLPKRRNSKTQAESPFIQTLKPLPEDPAQHSEIDKTPSTTTVVQVHSPHVNVMKVGGEKEALPVINLPDVPEREYDEILTDPEQTAL